MKTAAKSPLQVGHPSCCCCCVSAALCCLPSQPLPPREFVTEFTAFYIWLLDGRCLLAMAAFSRRAAG